MLKTFSALFIISLVLMLLLDGLWLGVMVKRFYAPHIGSLMADKPSLPPAILFYVIYIIGLNALVLWPSLQQNTPLLKTACTGALLGFVAYTTYDLTNQATLKNWPWILSAVDMIWGAVLTGSVSGGAVFLVRMFKG